MIDNLAVIVPAYNEGQVIESVIGKLAEHIKTIIVIDDGSRDNTYEQLKKTNATILRHFTNVGYGGSLRTGYEYALKTKHAFIATFDADDQHNVHDLLRMHQYLSQHGDIDVVLGSRFIQNGRAVNIGTRKKLMLKMVAGASRFVHGLHITDTFTGIRMFRKQALKIICADLKTFGMVHGLEILSKIEGAQLRFIELPATVQYTEYSKKKGLTLFDSIEMICEFFIRSNI
jgi:polyprenyl-phospho-N-acetylgalactosaminyl synthase